MSHRQLWIAVVLTLWGIPAILLWLGLGFFLKVSLRSTHEMQMQKISEVLDSLSKNSQDFFKSRLKKAFDDFSQLSVNSPDFLKRVEEIEKRFPPGLYKFHFFDSGGKILVASGTSGSLDTGKFFNFIRRSWRDDFPVDPDYFEGMNKYLPESERAAEMMRSRDGEISEVGQKNRSSQFPTWGFYRWNPNSWNKVGGMLVFILFANLPDDYILQGGFENTDLKLCKAGILRRSGVQLKFLGMSRDELEPVYEKYKNESANFFSFRNLLVEGRPFEDSAVFFAMAPLPEGPWKILAAIFVIYFIISLAIIFNLYGIIVRQEPWRLSLGKKLGMLFLWGVFFPILAASSLALLYLQEKRGDILEENRKSAFQVLDRIDQGYEREITRREKFYHRFSKGFSRGTISRDKVEKLLKKLWEIGNIDDFYIVSSQSQMVVDQPSRRKADFRDLLAYSPEKRIEYFENGLSKGDYPCIAEVDCLMGRIPYESIKPRQSAVTREITKKTVLYLAEEIFIHVNSLSGKPVARSEKAGSLAIKSAMGDDVLILMKFLTLNLGQLLESIEASSGFTYSDVLIDPAGEVPYILSMNHSFFTLQNDYLRRELSEEKRETRDFELRAYGYETVFSPDYPREGARQLTPIHDRMEAAKSSSLVCNMNLDGRQVEIAVRQPQNLRYIKLFHITPPEVLARRLRSFQILAGVCIFISCFFCLSLGYLLIQKFLVPLYGLSDGIIALRKKQFDHRVQVFSNDEIGHLSLALNKTIEHMKNMEVASTLQANLYPQERLQVGNFEIFGKNTMTQAIGGDYFDYFPLTDGRVAIILGDVSGHGVSAALVAAMAKSGFTILCGTHHQNPAEILEKINRQLLALVKRQKMMSCFLGILDSANETFTGINAGQCFPILVDQSGKLSFLDLPSSPLGILKTGKFRSRVVSVADKQIVLYSDGLAEAMNESNKPLGYDGFAEIVVKACREKPATPTDFIFGEVKKFTSPVAWADDATVIVIRKRS